MHAPPPPSPVGSDKNRPVTSGQRTNSFLRKVTSSTPFQANRKEDWARNHENGTSMIKYKVRKGGPGGSSTIDPTSSHNNRPVNIQDIVRRILLSSASEEKDIISHRVPLSSNILP